MSPCPRSCRLQREGARLPGLGRSEPDLRRPDEDGRVDTLSVREGDTIEKGAPLFTVDATCRRRRQHEQGDGQQRRGAHERARPARPRPARRKPSTMRRPRCAPRRRRLATAQTKLARRTAEPGSGTVQQIYFRPGELVPAGRPVFRLLPPGNIKVRFFVPEGILAAVPSATRCW